jgi:hypothetical protein
MMRHKRRPGLPGMIAVPAMVCLVLAMMLAAALLRSGLAAREVARDSGRRMQADWLAESGIERAASRLLAHDDYAGETWTITAAEMGGIGEGRVTIAIEEAEGRAGRKLARVVAEYPAGGVLVARASRAVRIDRAKRDEGGSP